MPTNTPGIHHITAIAGPPQRNVDFYVGLLGLRLVKKTVNFDDPGTYHLYYGDETGSPGSILTFFPWQDSIPGRPGKGMSSAVAYRVASPEAWMERFAEMGLDFDGPSERFGESVLGLHDPDGLRLELIAAERASGEGSIGDFHSCTLSLGDSEPTARVLTEVLGFEYVGEQQGRARLRSPSDAPGGIVDLIRTDERGRAGTGTIHHIAFRTRDEAEQREWREKIAAFGLNVTDVKDRKYFRSVYFREPGGVLFEIATDGPGFAVDEAPDELGSSLMLPSWLETNRSRIEMRLSALDVPNHIAP